MVLLSFDSEFLQTFHKLGYAALESVESKESLGMDDRKINNLSIVVEFVHVAFRL